MRKIIEGIEGKLIDLVYWLGDQLEALMVVIMVRRGSRL